MKVQGRCRAPDLSLDIREAIDDVRKSMRAQIRAHRARRAAVTPTKRELADRAEVRAARRTVDAMETLKRTLRVDVETEEGFR